MFRSVPLNDTRPAGYSPRSAASLNSEARPEQLPALHQRPAMLGSELPKPHCVVIPNATSTGAAPLLARSPERVVCSAPHDGLYGRAATRLLRLPTTATRGHFREKQPKLHPESLSDMPKRDHDRIALPFHWVKFGLYKHSRNQAKSRQFTSDRRNVRRLRITAGLSEAQLAERMGVDRAYVGGLELELAIQTSTTNSAHLAFWRIRRALRAGAAALCTPRASASRRPSAAVLGSSTADLVSSANLPGLPCLAQHRQRTD